MKYSVIVITAALAVSIIVAVVLVWPKYQEFSGLQAKIRQTETDLENQNKYLQELKTIESKMDERQELVARVDGALPIGPDAPSLLKLLQETSVQTGVTLDKMDWQSGSLRGVKEERIKEYSLDLTISGSYFAFKNFLLSLEKSARLMDMTRTTFSILQESEVPPSFRMTFKFYSY